jgi:hypothetical protein
MHCTAVEVVHDAVLQTPDDSAVDMVVSELPKFKPIMLTDECPEKGVFPIA